MPDQINVGYARFEDAVLSEVNGRPIHSMKDLINAIESHKGDRFRMLLENDAGEMVFTAAGLRERGSRILSNYRVPDDRSAELRAK